MTLYIAFRASREWEKTLNLPEPLYQEQVFMGADGVPLYGWVAIPKHPRGTIVATYGITGSLENQWFLRILGRKAYSEGFAVVLLDWRGHGKTAELSPTLTSDGLYEGEDFVLVAAQAKALGCPPKFWFMGYSLGGQLALWGVKAAADLSVQAREWGLKSFDIAGGAVLCPSLDSRRSLTYLMNHPVGRYIEKAIAKNLQSLAWDIYQTYPNAISPEAIARIDSIWAFDRELVIQPLGLATVEEYYQASSALPLISQLQKPTLILYAQDDPLFAPSLVPDLQQAAAQNPKINLILTQFGGHVGYLSSPACQRAFQDPDPWWAWNRMLDWIKQFELNE